MPAYIITTKSKLLNQSAAVGGLRVPCSHALRAWPSYHRGSTQPITRAHAMAHARFVSPSCASAILLHDASLGPVRKCRLDAAVVLTMNSDYGLNCSLPDVSVNLQASIEAKCRVYAAVVRAMSDGKADINCKGAASNWMPMYCDGDPLPAYFWGVVFAAMLLATCFLSAVTCCWCCCCICCKDNPSWGFCYCCGCFRRRPVETAALQATGPNANGYTNVSTELVAAATCGNATRAQLLEVAVPAWMAPGQLMTVTAPNGLSLQVEVPAGSAPGQTLLVEVPVSGAVEQPEQKVAAAAAVATGVPDAQAWGG